MYNQDAPLVGDITASVLTYLRVLNTGITFGARVPDAMPEPFVRVEKVDGFATRWGEVSTVRIDVWSDSPSWAAELAQGLVQDMGSIAGRATLNIYRTESLGGPSVTLDNYQPDKTRMRFTTTALVRGE
jgi:hypothetical protein